MNCPFCDTPMEEGTITGDGHAIKWVSDDRKPGRLFRKRVPMTASWPEIQHDAFFCPYCKKVIVDVADLVKDKDY